MVEFLKHLLRQRLGKWLVIWDGLPAHRSRVVRDFLRQQRKRLEVEFLLYYVR